jgi:hypothetical protein
VLGLAEEEWERVVAGRSAQGGEHRRHRRGRNRQVVLVAAVPVEVMTLDHETAVRVQVHVDEQVAGTRPARDSGSAVEAAGTMVGTEVTLGARLAPVKSQSGVSASGQSEPAPVEQQAPARPALLPVSLGRRPP